MATHDKTSSSSRKIVFVMNGPPGSGKDTAAAYLSEKYGVQHLEFKEHLFNMALMASGISDNEWFDRYEDRSLKDTPWDKLGNISQRQFMITISESWLKPIFGKRYFGDIAKKNVDICSNNLIVFSDGGFQEEVEALMGDNTTVVLVHLTRPDTSFKNDSRNYVNMLGKVLTVEIMNDDSIEVFQSNLDQMMKQIEERFFSDQYTYDESVPAPADYWPINKQHSFSGSIEGTIPNDLDNQKIFNGNVTLNSVNVDAFVNNNKLIINTPIRVGTFEIICEREPLEESLNNRNTTNE